MLGTKAQYELQKFSLYANDAYLHFCQTVYML